MTGVLRSPGRARATAAVLGVAVLLSTAGVALASRAWLVTASPLLLQVGDQATVTLSVQNVGGNGGGDEITCVTVDIPGSFSIDGASVESVKGTTSGHGWTVVIGASTVTFKNPDDSNPLVGLPEGDVAQFRITVTPGQAGVATWAADAADKPGSAGSTKCGSGDFPDEPLAFTIAPGATPRPTPAPPTPAPTPTPTPASTPAPTRTPTPTPATTSRPSASPIATVTPFETPATTPPSPTVPPSPTAVASPAVVPSASPSASSEPATIPASGTSGGPGSSPRIIDGSQVTIGRRTGDGSAGVAPGDLDDAAMAAVTSLGIGAFTVPGLVVGVPGFLLVLAVLLQLVGGGAWLPLARRWLAGVGMDRRRTSRTARIVRD